MIIRTPPLNMLDEGLIGTECVCKYSNPNRTITLAVILTMLIYFDHKINDKIFNRFLTLAKLTSGLIILGTSFSELMSGVSNISNIISAILLGMLIFFASRKYEDEINTILIWPILYKDRYKNKPAIFTLLSILMGLNYLSFFLYGLNITFYELDNNMIRDMKNCFHCTDKENLSYQFSLIHFKESLIFNFGVGGLLGIYMSKKKIFDYKGLISDNNYKKFAFRLIIYFSFFLPLLLMIIWTG